MYTDLLRKEEVEWAGELARCLQGKNIVNKLLINS